MNILLFCQRTIVTVSVTRVKLVNVGDLWIETSSNWIFVALYLLLSASVLMRITAPIYLALN